MPAGGSLVLARDLTHDARTPGGGGTPHCLASARTRSAQAAESGIPHAGGRAGPLGSGSAAASPERTCDGKWPRARAPPRTPPPCRDSRGEGGGGRRLDRVAPCLGRQLPLLVHPGAGHDLVCKPQRAPQGRPDVYQFIAREAVEIIDPFDPALLHGQGECAGVWGARSRHRVCRGAQQPEKIATNGRHARHRIADKPTARKQRDCLTAARRARVRPRAQLCKLFRTLA